MKIAVAGGGIAGLVAALRLYKDHDVTIFERDGEPGGNIRSQSFDGFLFEWGPSGFASSSLELRDVIRECGLEDEIVPAHAAATKRYVYYGGALHALPARPGEALRLSLLSPAGKFRALRGLVLRPPPGGADESVYTFFARRFGDEVAERVVVPALLGITAGDARATSMNAAFPRVRELERQHGSLFRAMLRSGRARGRLSTLRGGMTRLVDGLAGTLGGRLVLSCGVARLSRNGSRWRMEHARGSDDFDAVVLAIPAYASAPILRDVDARLAALLEGIAYAPMRVAGIAFRAEDVRRPLDGFGFLAARDQGVRILGALYTSTIFPDQAPPGTAYLRVFLGGSSDPQAMDLAEDQARKIIQRDLETTLGITAPPLAYHEHRWVRGIPQYALGHTALLGEIDRRLASLRGIALTGNAYRGMGVADCIRDAAVQVDRLVHRGTE